MDFIGTLVCIPIYTAYTMTVVASSAVLVPTALLHAAVKKVFFASPAPTKKKEKTEEVKRFERFFANLETLVNNHPSVVLANQRAEASAALEQEVPPLVTPPVPAAHPKSAESDAEPEEFPEFEVPEEDDENLTAAEEEEEEEKN